MVASISARGGAKAALSYYGHLRRDDYYARGGEPPGRWAGEAAERLSLRGPVTQTEFDAALRGFDPKTGERLAQFGGRSREHSSGWDMTFSAPKSVSVLWALSRPEDRGLIEQAQRSAVLAATKHLESSAASARRGRGGAVTEKTAGLLIAKFDHHTSRELDPQLHTHSFIFNLAPRRDGSWGAIVSRELYKSQKQAGGVYRKALGRELERMGHALEWDDDKFRVASIPRHIERALSKRRQAIEEAAQTYGYKTAKGMELAALRTRRAKQEATLDGMFATWRAEATAMGFQLGRDHGRRQSPSSQRSTIAISGRTFATPTPPQPPAGSAAASIRQSAVQIGVHLGRLLRALDQPSRMPGVKVSLRNSNREHERE